MVITTDADIVEQILAHEGPYSDHPQDTGGKTAWGISQVHHPDMWMDGPPTRDRAKLFYQRRYLDAFKDVEPITLKAQVVDIAVNSGILTARAMLTNARRQTERPVGTQLVIERLKHYARIVKSKPTQSVFLLGWINRAVAFLGVLLVCSVGLWASDTYRTHVTVVREESWDTNGIQHFHLKLSNGTRATLAIDGDLALAKALQQRVNQPLVLTLEPARLAR